MIFSSQGRMAHDFFSTGTKKSTFARNLAAKPLSCAQHGKEGMTDARLL
jgi:hypothetical protein